MCTIINMKPLDIIISDNLRMNSTEFFVHLAVDLCGTEFDYTMDKSWSEITMASFSVKPTVNLCRLTQVFREISIMYCKAMLEY